MNAQYSFEIYTAVDQLPSDWNDLAQKNIFLSTDYLKVLATSAPPNMRCHFVGIFKNNVLSGIALSQFLDMRTIESFGDRDSCMKTKIRNVVFKNFSSKVLFIGNNMLTGQNAFAFADSVIPSDGVEILYRAAMQIKDNLSKQGLGPHLTVWKDFNESQSPWFNMPEFEDHFKFVTQPNMIFDIPQHWQSFDDYLLALQKKYRDQYKRARKKAEGLTKKELSLEEITKLQPSIYKLYLTVAQNAPFNTFFLKENHFAAFKQSLGDRFVLHGYFDGATLVGFSTMIQNGKDIDTYFLGYDETCQREKMLYLNMLYDMTTYAINHRYSRVIFARTALEIKSSIGAAPADAFGFIRHNNKMLNRIMRNLFRYFEPENNWQQRHPFKD